jgi:hypothetical protein
MSYKMEFAGLEGWLMGAVLFSLPFVLLTVMIKLFLSEKLPSSEAVQGHTPGTGVANFGPSTGDVGFILPASEGQPRKLNDH